MSLFGVMLGAAIVLAGEGDTVGFELKEGVILVEATVNGKGPFRFVFDTGSPATVLSPATAATLGLDRGTVDVDALAVGKAGAGRVPVVVKAVPRDGVDGILGATFISRFVSTIDYTAKTIRLVPVAAATLGFSYRTIPDDLANEIGLEGGLEVRAVAPGGPAAQGGLRKGDVIREMNGRRVDTADQYRALLATVRPGDAVAFKVVRDRKDVEVKVTAAERP